MSDILDDAREMLAEITERRPLQTHYEGCRRDHAGCLIAAMICEIERLRLTDAERGAIGVAVQCVEAARAQRHPTEEDARDLLWKTACGLRGLLERTICHNVGE